MVQARIDIGPRPFAILGSIEEDPVRILGDLGGRIDKGGGQIDGRLGRALVLSRVKTIANGQGF